MSETQTMTLNDTNDLAVRNERLEALAAFVEKLPEERFDMDDWRQESACGTVACLAGWTPEVAGVAGDVEDGRVSCRDYSAHVSDFAEDWIGLNDQAAKKLFYTGGWPELFTHQPPTPARAAARIRHFIATGE